MPRFNFELRSQGRIWDTVPVERDDLTALRTEMAVFVGDLLKEHASQVWEDQEWRIDVTDETGLILYVMHLSATDTAATMPLGR